MRDDAEAALIRRCREGDEGAFRELVERYQRRTFYIARNMVNNAETAREISQEAFVRVFRHLDRFDSRKNFYTWLYQIVVNLCIDHLRRASHARTVDIDALDGLADAKGGSPVEAGEAADRRLRVHRTLDLLPPKYKAILVLRDIQGFSCGEIAGIVGCSGPTLRWRLHRARGLFREAWEGRVPVAGEESGGA